MFLFRLTREPAKTAVLRSRPKWRFTKRLLGQEQRRMAVFVGYLQECYKNISTSKFAVKYSKMGRENHKQDVKKIT